jgi:hypothetical protein
MASFPARASSDQAPVMLPAGLPAHLSASLVADLDAGKVGATSSLAAALAAVPDARHRRGRRHELTGVLAIGAWACLTGARSYVAIGEWADAQGQAVLDGLGEGGGDRVLPCEATLRLPGASYNQDHNAAFRACISAHRPYPRDLKHSPGLVLSYSHIDEAYWNTTCSLGCAPNFWVDISSWTAHKRRASSCYQSQMKSHSNHWRTVANIELINRVSGIRAGVSSAEEFLLLSCSV